MVASMQLFVFVSLSSICWGMLIQVDLGGNWTVHDENRGIEVTGRVPGNMYTALHENKMIQDPYYRKNDAIYRWIARDNWTYSRTFNVTKEMMRERTLVLVCDGLDTVAEIFINGQLIGMSDNMFVRYVYNIKPASIVGMNTIKIMFKSAVKYAAEQADNYGYVVPPECPYYHGDCHVNMIRKMQSSFSWDWGPSFPTQGIWRSIYVQGYSSAVVRDVAVETILDQDGGWTLQIDVFLDVLDHTVVTGHLQFDLEGTSVTHQTPVSITGQNSSVSVTLPIDKNLGIKKWWPNGHGQQTLYRLWTSFYGINGTEITNKSINVGFRTVEVVQDYVSTNQKQGRTFYFRINGRPIYFKGSNWIPADVLQDRITPEYVGRLLEAAAAVHINVLRVWGGGVYESDVFYEEADRLGIMVWQDFMFGCAMYPVHRSFMDSVASELTYQIRRLKHHPSIVIWSGNNENEKALIENWYDTSGNFTLYKRDYLILYKDLMAPIVAKEDTSRPFVLSSPGNGRETDMEGGIAKDPASQLYGDIHEYKYLELFYVDWIYRVPRFSSEYGLQSFPSFETLEKVYAEGDFDFWSDLNEYRQHHPAGNVELMAQISMLFHLPNNTDRKQRFKDSIYLTQITQAVGIKMETEHYRRWQNLLDSSGRGNTMGAMYWQLNDIWQAPTWASLEYGGKWKMLHYYARHFFAPLLIAPYIDGDDIGVFIVIDQIPMVEVRHPTSHTLTFHPDTSSGDYVAKAMGLKGQLHIAMYIWNSFVPLHTWTQDYTLNTTSQSVYRRNINDMMTDAGCIRGRNYCFLYFYLNDSNDEPVAWQPLTEYKNIIGLPRSTVQVTDVQQSTSDANAFTITVSANAIAVFVWLDAHSIEGRFSDNGFLMVNSVKTVKFFTYLHEHIDVLTLRNALTARSLTDVYQ